MLKLILIGEWCFNIVDECYSPNCFLRSFQLSDHLYTPPQPYFTAQQIRAMKESRLKFLEHMFVVAPINRVTKDRDNIKPFCDLNVKVKIESAPGSSRTDRD